VATKLALLLRSRGMLVFALLLLAGVLGSVHHVLPSGFGFWDGPL
jgi:hypothetical protein